jgi:hypothetical protein
MATIVSKVLTHMTANADRPLTAQGIAEELDITVGQVANAVSHIKENNPGRIEKRGRAVYIWRSQAQQKPPMKRGDAMLVEIVRDDDDKRLILDEDGGLWKMERLADY